ncbi:membrane protein insertase YidC [Rivibacter subsaxonicus]|uniref:Membrane protein insertase YidC n=1 Tax=Rivibacter subsaxonicus TaxID=457575 RepID=A0A4Q7VW53_9BURK|nr:membrane protein insertase YidC [Rivibacter subsaxonicus]RZU00911.1 protein translocase subunit yidC [Rivibacter subsaxonicus]
MTDMRRTVLWVVFTMSLVLLWDAWNKHNGHPPMFFGAGAKPAVTAPAPGSAPAIAGSAAVPAPMAGGAASVTAAAAVAPVGGASAPAAGTTFTVTSDLIKASFDSAGASLVRLELLHHVDQNDKTRNVVLFDRSAERVYLAQTGLVGAPDLPSHLSPMQLVPGATTLQDGADELNVRFESPVMGGVKLAKTFTFKRGSYAVKVTHEVQNVGTTAISPQLYQQLVRDGNPPPGESSFYFTFTGPAVYTDAAKFKKIEFKDIEKGNASIDKSADNGWVAMVQHYFISAWLHGDAAAREFYARKVDTNLYAIGQLFALGPIEPGQTRSFTSQLYAGPQEEKKLEELAPGLDLVKDYGIFTILAKPLFWLLSWLYQLIGNWGWAIVALVVLLKAAFYGLNARAYASMARMKKVNPRIMEMRERLKDNPQQMQQEMMRIYREEKINPLGSCLPILVQIPVFIALYWVLLSSVEMRNAQWLWITDLSAKDPYFILPIVMTATSLLQTWLNPTPPDPVQAKLMWIMPLVFGIMFFFFPAGLVLYWITNNVLSIAQQWFINRRLGVN